MDDFEDSLNTVLVETFNDILKYEEQSLRHIASPPVTIGEAHMIEAVGRQDGATVSGLAIFLGIAVPTATVAVKKLERKGLVQKVPCADDGRRAIIRLTPAGEKINRAHSIFHKKMVRNISREFAEPEKQVLLTAIEKLNDFFKNKVEA
ncbi:MAG: MarR family transcriptional regulator [Oscillospiraceae bacterium]|nr:MarR family transcriptional regulator [Oscillospiraceae bacterium]